MKKNVLIVCVIILIILVAVVGWFLYNQKRPKGYPDITKASNSQIISLLNKSTDAKDYMHNHPDFTIQKKEILTKDSIVAGQNGQNFKEVYQGLELQDNRYMVVNLMNQAGDKGLIALIDFKTQSTPKAYGIILFKVGQSNGQTPSSTTNK